MYMGVLAFFFQKNKKIVGWTSTDEAEPLSFSFLLETCLALLSIVCLYYEIRFMIRRRQLPPGDSGWPILGHFVSQMGDPPTFYKAKGLEMSRSSMANNNSMMYTVNCLMEPVVMFVQDDDVAWALKQERQGNMGAYVFEFFQRVVGEHSIMFQSGDHHKRLRKIFEPAFTPQAIRDYLPIMDSVTQESLARLAQRGAFCESREWAMLAMRIFCRCAFGRVNEERNEKLSRYFEGWINGMDTRIPLELPFTPLGHAHKCKQKLGQLLSEMIAEFKALHAPNDEAAKKSVLGRLVYSVDENGQPPTDAQLVDNIRFILFAGFDTTKSSFGAIAHFLMQNPPVLELLVQEVQGFADPLDFDQLKGAPVLNAVLAESWRLTAPMACHTMRTKCPLEYKQYQFPAKTIVCVDTQAYHEINQDLYPDGTEFRIERWLPEDHPLYNPKYRVNVDYNNMTPKYRPFNLGPHMCLGAHFAKLEVRVVMTRLLQKYDLEIRNQKIRKSPTLQYTCDFKLTERASQQ